MVGAHRVGPAVLAIPRVVAVSRTVTVSLAPVVATRTVPVVALPGRALVLAVALVVCPVVVGPARPVGAVMVHACRVRAAVLATARIVTTPVAVAVSLAPVIATGPVPVVARTRGTLHLAVAYLGSPCVLGLALSGRAIVMGASRIRTAGTT